MEIIVLVENSSYNQDIKGVHGLSLVIKTIDKTILYDFGPKNSLHKNANLLSIHLKDIDFAVLSHNHVDHGGDINNFCKLNKKALIHVNTDLSDKLYTKLFSFIKFPVGIRLKSRYKNRIVEHNKSEEIVKNTYLLKLSEYRNESSLNQDLYISRNGKLEKDDFQHESALVINDNNELVVFCSCSHHGVSNILNDVESSFPDHKIKAFIGGFHMCNPISKKNESEIFIKKEIVDLKKRNIIYYTGHCTGEFALTLFKNEIMDRVIKISTGMKIII